VDAHAQRSPLQSLNFAPCASRTRLRPAARTPPASARAWTRSSPTCRSCCTSARARDLYVDSSGEPLFKRGWREDKGDAPLKETLAAAMLAAAGWRGTPEAGGALHDPCCGSGTIAIEAAQIACGIAPGLQRRFAFERLLPFDEPECRAAWQRLKSHAQTRIRPSACPSVRATCPFRMVDLRAPQCASAPASSAHHFNGGDALERPRPPCPRSCRHADDEPAVRRAHRGRRQGGACRTGDNRRCRHDFFPAWPPLEARLHAASRRLDRVVLSPT
jgi:putative N6-adenine-specific DNA methylase